jgi:hypothetical protein
MGHILLYGFCKCGKMYGKTNGKTVFNDCKCSKMKFKQMEQKDFEHMAISLQETKEPNTKKQIFEYWQKRVNGRLNELAPLITELNKKNISLLSLSKELNEEYLELNNVKLFYNF